MIILAYFLFRMLLGGNSLATNRAIIHTAFSYTEWVCVKEDRGISLHERWIQVNDSLKVRERKGEFVVNCNMDDVAHYLKDYKTVDKWMKGVKQVRMVNSNDKDLVYMVIHLPWPFSDRDFFALYSSIQMDSNHMIIKVNSEENSKTTSKKLVRIKDYRASWKLQHINQQKTKITFTVFSSEPPLFPQWMQEPVIKKVFLNNLKRLQSALNKN